MSLTTCLFIYGRLLVGLAGAMAFSAFLALVYRDGPLVGVFLLSGALTLFVGGGLIIATRGRNPKGDRRELVLLAALFWAVTPVFAALPLWGSALPDADAAYFEALSGLTTTGATLLTGLDGLPRSLLFWRALCEWLGGLASIVLGLALLWRLPLGGAGETAMLMPRREGQSLHADLRGLLGQVWWVYALMTAACAVALFGAGLRPFDAVCQAFSTLSTGGFSTRDHGLAEFGSPAVTVIVLVFLLAGATGFSLHWSLLRQGRWAYGRDPESRLLLGLALLLSLVLAASLATQGGRPLDAALAEGLVLAVGAVTSSGLSLSAEAGLPLFCASLLGFVVLIGGSAGSTAGGFKLVRVLLLVRLVRAELGQLCIPRGVQARRQVRNRPVDDQALRRVWSFFAVYMIAFIALVLALGLVGLDFAPALGAAAATLGNVGPAYSLIAGSEASFAAAPDGARPILCLAMFLGRMELFSVLALVTPSFWRP